MNVDTKVVVFFKCQSSLMSNIDLDQNARGVKHLAFIYVATPRKDRSFVVSCHVEGAWELLFNSYLTFDTETTYILSREYLQ